MTPIRDTDFLGDYMPEPPPWMDEIPPPDGGDLDEPGEERKSERPTPPSPPVEHEEPEDDIPF